MAAVHKAYEVEAASASLLRLSFECHISGLSVRPGTVPARPTAHWLDMGAAGAGSRSLDPRFRVDAIPPRYTQPCRCFITCRSLRRV